MAALSQYLKDTLRKSLFHSTSEHKHDDHDDEYM
jgi:hypothetical protein